MPEIFDTGTNDGGEAVVDWAQRVGGRSEVRIVLEGLTPGQAVVYGPDEPAHRHSPGSVDKPNKYACTVQEMVGRINRRMSTIRLKSIHNDKGEIFVTCFERGVYRGN
jgi:hypothetical protein